MVVSKRRRFDVGSNESRCNDTSTQTLDKTSFEGCGSVVRSCVLKQLAQRAVNGSHIKSPPAVQWTPCPWVSLECDEATCMTWDGMGALCVVGTITKQVCLWEWDTVVAVDINKRGRSDREKDVIAPVLKVNLPHVVNDIAWSQDDLLAFAFRGLADILIYRLEVNDSPNTKNPYKLRRMGRCRPPSYIPRVITPLKVMFLNGSNVAVSYTDGSVLLWEVLSTPRVLWSWKLSEGVSAIHRFGKRWLLVGGRGSSLVWLDWKNARRKAFSADMLPTVLMRMDTHAMAVAQKEKTPSRSWMGIQTLHVSNPSSDDPTALGRCLVTWVTRSGWVLSLDLQNRAILEIFHRPALVETRSHDDLVAYRTLQHSLPVEPVRCAQKGQVMFWSEVPQVTHILPHHDRRILQQRQIVRSSKVALLWLDGQRRVLRVPMKRLPHPTKIAVHPSLDWLLLASGRGLNLFSPSRGR